MTPLVILFLKTGVKTTKGTLFRDLQIFTLISHTYKDSKNYVQQSTKENFFIEYESFFSSGREIEGPFLPSNLCD